MSSTRVLALVLSLLWTVGAVRADGKALTGGSRPIDPVANRSRNLTHSEANSLIRHLKGKTSAAVVSQMGVPDALGPSRSYRYRFGTADLVLHIRDGRVESASSRDERQTGVQDDDFVGLTSP
jgi:hypothetical protein